MNMEPLGSTRSVRRPDHILQTPDTFVRASLPGMENCTAVVHTGPAAGASFTEYTAEMEPGGSLGPASGQRFFYVLAGAVRIDDSEKRMRAGGYAYLPSRHGRAVVAEENSKIVVIEKHYQRLDEHQEPKAFHGSEDSVPSHALMEDEDIQVRSLIPADMEFDFAVNTMTFLPGASLPMVEMHIMEHGLLMLDGGGIYRLGDSWYPVAAGDFIWMSPFCPQWFGAIGKKPARYLIYKDWNRHPLSSLSL